TGNAQGVHLHFEVKHFGVLGNLNDDYGPMWGYSDGHPNLYGYLDPWPYLDYGLAQLEVPAALIPSSSQSVRAGPDPTQYTTTITTVSSSQRFAAFASYNGWYEIFLPSINGPATGWIQGTFDSLTCVRQVNDRPSSGLSSGVNVRLDPSTSNPFVSKVWNKQ